MKKHSFITVSYTHLDVYKRQIQNLVGLTDKERSQILSINMANHPGRKYKEVFFLSLIHI